MTLTGDQVEAFHERGYLGPLAVCSPEEMAVRRARLDNTVLAEPEHRWSQRHLDLRDVYELCALTALGDAMEAIVGPDLILWSTKFRVKHPGAKEIPWHQDVIYWRLEPMINVSAWLAIDDADEENACVQLLPGSHRETLTHQAAGGDMHQDFTLEVDLAGKRFGDPVSMALRAGECFLFSERTVHRSSANRPRRRRAGLTIRVTTPSVRVQQPGHDRVILLRGKDRFRYNTLAPAPEG
jgi:ectoine hydroxylase-related dioxygenase (phytanoyl-CoA dioxygenase family)